ncbi:type I secretion system protein LssZ [Legionella cardiaca]|uniref:Type I secretion system protein LssZ n=1 Tax=Legionella cardiaca TaxID=1071983 RepID=A0ABY8AXW2_9GAMM|nr:type I secretion system protein LssZ [Legionella cardiaca]WED44335.1 type I secretion system protein LssZ [Legionella cardiaca]
MINIAEIIHILLPLLGLLVLILGFILKRSNYILVALWVSLITLLLEYRDSGGEILGSYFNYFHATTYSVNLVVLVVSILYFMFAFLPKTKKTIVHYLTGLVSALVVTGAILLLSNLWINARFVEDRLPGTPILQVATFSKQPYCDYKYVFYKVNSGGKVKFMCPNHYGLLPSTGELTTAPGFVIKQLPKQVQDNLQKQT